jgi:SAM-dependent methyltransferase
MSQASDGLIYEKIKKIVKHKIQSSEMLPDWQKIHKTLNSLPLDKRQEATGADVVIWFWDVASKSDSAWNQHFGGHVYAVQDEMIFHLINPQKVLLAYPSLVPDFVEVICEKSDLTLLNNIQLQLLEKSFQEELQKYTYQLITMQEIETGTSKKFDVIYISLSDIYHDAELVVNFFNLLEKNGCLVITHANEDGRLYGPENEYTVAFDVHQKLKNLEDSFIYHNPLISGKTFVKKLSN